MTRRTRIIMTRRTRLPCQVKVEGGMVLLVHDVVDAANILRMIIMMVFIAKVTDFDYEGTRQESHSNPWGTGDQAR